MTMHSTRRDPYPLAVYVRTVFSGLETLGNLTLREAFLLTPKSAFITRRSRIESRTFVKALVRIVYSLKTTNFDN